LATPLELAVLFQNHYSVEKPEKIIWKIIRADKKIAFIYVLILGEELVGRSFLHLSCRLTTSTGDFQKMPQINTHSMALDLNRTAQHKSQ
jgi:hypothetical protein